MLRKRVEKHLQKMLRFFRTKKTKNTMGNGKEHKKSLGFREQINPRNEKDGKYNGERKRIQKMLRFLGDVQELRPVSPGLSLANGGKNIGVIIQAFWS